jgi:hypothetical protein
MMMGAPGQEFPHLGDLQHRFASLKIGYGLALCARVGRLLKSCVCPDGPPLRLSRDVHAIDQPDLPKTFKSFSQMQRWFTEHAAGAKAGTQ